MSKMIERVCQCGCGETFMARARDVKRGWASTRIEVTPRLDQTIPTGEAGVAPIAITTSSEPLFSIP